MALPCLMELEASGFSIHALGRGWASDLLSGYDWSVTALPKSVWAAGRATRELKPRRGLLFTNSISSALAMRLGRVQAIGYRGDCRSLLLHRGLVKPSGLHEVEYFWRLGEVAHSLWGHDSVQWPSAPPRRVELRVTRAHRSAALAAQARHRVEPPFVVCCPAATGKIGDREKVWPHFDSLCRELLASGQRVVACPGPTETPACTAALPGATIMPDLSLGAYAAVMSMAERVIANDSGPMHLAAAVGAPVVGIFGVTDPGRTRPWGGKYVGSAEGWPDLGTVLAACDDSSQDDRELLPLKQRGTEKKAA